MFQQLLVKNITRETKDTVSVSFVVPKKLSEAFQYQAGQYLTMRTILDGNEIRRSYSLCSSPFQNEWKVAIKMIPSGLFSTFANTVLKEGDSLDVMPPTGNFILNNKPQNSKSIIAFAAGSGITPIISILGQHLHDSTDSHAQLYYGNQKKETTIFYQELEDLKTQFPERFKVNYILSREETNNSFFSGRLDRKKCLHYTKTLFSVKEVDQFFLCGPQSMVSEIEKTLLECGASSDQIKYELFTTDSSQEKENTIKREVDFTCKVEVTVDDDTYFFDFKNTDADILSRALEEDADVPFACRGGVCCTCKAKVMKGEVEMKVNYALEPEEVEAGYVLSCQAVPISKEVHISFDE